MDFFDLVVARDQRDARREADRNNAARLGFSQHKVQSSGTGNIRRADPIKFDVIFIEEPLFTQGATVIQRPADGSDPIASTGVWQWDRNPKGHYVGAYIYLAVWLGEISFEAVGSEVQMTHHLLFQGMGYKDLGQGVTTEAQLIAPRSTGFGV